MLRRPFFIGLSLQSRNLCRWAYCLSVSRHVCMYVHEKFSMSKKGFKYRRRMYAVLLLPTSYGSPLINLLRFRPIQLPTHSARPARLLPTSSTPDSFCVRWLKAGTNAPSPRHICSSVHRLTTYSGSVANVYDYMIFVQHHQLMNMVHVFSFPP